MRLLALLLVPAFIGMVVSQNQGQHHMYDQARFNGGASGNKRPVFYPGGPQQGHFQHNGGNMVNHPNVGAPPPPGSSRQIVPDLAPVQPGPIVGQVGHSNVGNGPAPDQFGGGSRAADVPLGAVQTDMLDRVDMVNRGQAPVRGNNQNSGEVLYDYGQGAGAPQIHPHHQGGAGGEQVFGNNGGNSGNGGPVYNAGTFSDNAGQGAPLGGAAMDEFKYDPAASTGAASVGSTVAGVVCAVLVLVGIVTVAAVFLVRQRQSRMTIASV